MKRIAVCLALLPLVGCASGAPMGHGPRAFCEHQAANDPEVVRLTMQSLSHPSESSLAPQIGLAKHRALNRCLLQRGVAPPGGVERVVPQ